MKSIPIWIDLPSPLSSLRLCRRSPRQGRLQGSPRLCRRGRLRRRRSRASRSPPRRPTPLDQRNLVFEPHVLPVLVGTTVDFLNSDAVQHNVFSPDACADKFNLGTWPKGQRALLHVQEGVRGDAPVQGAPGDGGVRRRGPHPVLRGHVAGRRLQDRRRSRRRLHGEGLASEAEGDAEGRHGRGATEATSRSRSSARWPTSASMARAELPLQVGVPRPHGGGQVRHPDRAGEVPRGLRGGPAAEPSRLDLRPDLRRAVRDGLPARRARRPDRDPGA